MDQDRREITVIEPACGAHAGAQAGVGGTEGPSIFRTANLLGFRSGREDVRANEPSVVHSSFEYK